MSNFSSKLKQHCTPATFISFLALVFAVSGVSYAASNGSAPGRASNPQAGSAAPAGATAFVAKSKPKSGPRGPKGATGPTGPAGKNGANGTNGTPGAAGPQGPAGAAGSAGQGVTSTPLAAGEGGCVKGGVQLTSASGANTICNGERGTRGVAGPEGNIKATLPEGKTETGTWDLSTTGNSVHRGLASISFPIPLASPLSDSGCEERSSTGQPCQAHYINKAVKKSMARNLHPHPKTRSVKGPSQTRPPNRAISVSTRGNWSLKWKWSGTRSSNLSLTCLSEQQALAPARTGPSWISKPAQ